MARACVAAGSPFAVCSGREETGAAEHSGAARLLRRARASTSTALLVDGAAWRGASGHAGACASSEKTPGISGSYVCVQG
jgi:hypothetical protein